MINALLNVIFPKKCIFCDCALSIDAPICICEDCAPRIPYYAGEYLYKSERHGAEPASRSKYERSDKACNRIICALKYDDIVKRTLSRYKFHCRGEYGLTLAAMLCDRIMRTDAGRIDRYDLVTCVPLAHKRMRERGYNQAAILAKYTAQGLCLPFVDNLLSRDEYALRQSTLRRAERNRNVQAAFHINEQKTHTLATMVSTHALQASLSEMRILLIDDIATSMSTINACAAVLKAAGAHEVVGAVLASA